MFAILIAALIAYPGQVPTPVPDAADRYGNAMRCAGVMAATSSLHGFTGNTEAQAQSDRLGRAFANAAARYAQPLALTPEQLAAAFTASTTTALSGVARTSDQSTTDAAVDRLNTESNACLAMARGWAANGTS